MQRTRLIDPLMKLEELFHPPRVVLAQGNAQLFTIGGAIASVDIEASMRDPNGLIEMAFQPRRNDRLFPNSIASVLTIYRSGNAELGLLAIPQTGDTVSSPLRAYMTQQQFCGFMKNGVSFVSFDYRTQIRPASFGKNEPKLNWSITPGEHFCSSPAAPQAKRPAQAQTPKTGVAAKTKHAR